MSTVSTDTYDQVGIREDLTNLISNISPTNTPFLSNAPTGKAKSTLHEWQTDSLASVADNKAVEGADATFAPAAATVRLNNQTQIGTKTVITSGTLESTDRAGRAKEMAYQINKRSKELKRDMEHALVGLSNAKAAGSNSVARELASYQSWAATNRNAAGAAPTGDGTDIPTDATQRAFTEAFLENVIDQIFTEGGDADIIMAGTFNKRAISGFSGNATTTFHENADKTVINAVDVYVSDFGTLAVVPNRFLRARDVLVYQKDMWEVTTLRPFQLNDIAKTGDAMKKQLLVEYTLTAKNEKSSGIVADLTTA